MGDLVNENVLLVDLASGETEEEMIDEEFFGEHLSGAAANLALYERHADGDPVVLGTGFLTGTLVPGGGAGVVTAKSPRTGVVCHAPLTLYLGAELKYAGFDFVVLKGAAQAPTCLWLHDGMADVKDGSSLWGKTAWEATDAIRRDLGEDVIQVLSMGPAAERGEPAAGLVANYWPTPDRFGFAGLLGKKNVKAVAIRGMGLFDLSDEEGFVAACMDLAAQAKELLSGKGGGVGPIAAAMGEDIASWLAPLTHRHKADFGTPYAANTFLATDQDPSVMQETQVAEPGMLLTDAGDVLALKALGMDAKQTARALAVCARQGVDPAAAARLAAEQGISDADSLEKALASMSCPAGDAPPGTMAALAPDRPVFGGFGDLSGEAARAEWWNRRQAVGAIFGMDPRFMCMAPFLTEEKLCELVSLGAGLTVDREKLDDAVNKVLGE
ncbi:MAG: hypothetical protein JRI97_01990 [Deltaproteobacteria bacterium]|nr:hypothetical protein [Deltaproteobacteria bacterium]